MELPPHRRRRRRPRRAPRGFSLTEVIVVLSVLAILVGFLMPLIKVARRSARATACLAQLRAWGDDFRTQTADRRTRGLPCGPFPTRPDQQTPPTWWDALRPRADDLSQTLICPEATAPSPTGLPESPHHAWAPDSPADAPHRPRGVLAASYGFNAWLYAPDPLAPAGAAVLPPPADEAAVPVVFDAARPELFPRDTDAPKLFRAGANATADGHLQLAALERHKRSTHVAFLDGHVRPVAPADLWRLKWSPDFRPRDVELAE